MLKAIVSLLFIVVLSLQAETEADFQKYLKSEVRAEVYAQNLLDGGYYKKAKEFLKIAREKYADNIELMMYSATVHYNLDELDEAKRFFVLTLQLDPNNEQASTFIAQIEEQEAAKENKVIADIFDYLQDKGLDFLLIFLAFLGGEIIAKKYHNCNTFGVSQSIQNFFTRDKLIDSALFRIWYTFKSCCLSNKVVSICAFLDMLIVITISSSVLIVWLLLEIFLEIQWFLPESLLVIDSEAMSSHIINTFLILSVITLLVQFITTVQHISKDKNEYAIAIAQQFQLLLADNEIMTLHRSIKSLKSHPNYSEEVAQEILDNVYDESDKDILADMFQKTLP